MIDRFENLISALIQLFRQQCIRRAISLKILFSSPHSLSVVQLV